MRGIERMSTDCSKHDMNLLMALHNELPRRTRMGIERHLKSCASCRMRSEEFGVVSTTYKELLRAGVTVPISKFEPAPKTSHSPLRYVLVVTLICAAITFAYWGASTLLFGERVGATSKRVPTISPHPGSTRTAHGKEANSQSGTRATLLGGKKLERR